MKKGVFVFKFGQLSVETFLIFDHSAFNGFFACG